MGKPGTGWDKSPDKNVLAQVSPGPSQQWVCHHSRLHPDRKPGSEQGDRGGHHACDREDSRLYIHSAMPTTLTLKGNRLEHFATRQPVTLRRIKNDETIQEACIFRSKTVYRSQSVAKDEKVWRGDLGGVRKMYLRRVLVGNQVNASKIANIEGLTRMCLS